MKLKKIVEDLYQQMTGQTDDHEVEMAITDLRAMAQMASELAQHFENEKPKDLEGWVQAKITKAADYIDAVHKNHMYSPDQDCQSCGDVKEAMEPKTAYGDMVFMSMSNLVSSAKKLSKPENYSVLSDKEGKKVMLTTNERATQFEKEGNWMKIGKIDPNGNYRKQESTLFEATSALNEEVIKIFGLAKPYKGSDAIKLQTEAANYIKFLQSKRYTITTGADALYFPDFVWAGGKQQLGKCIGVLVGSNTIVVSPIGKNREFKVGEPLVSRLVSNGIIDAYLLKGSVQESALFEVASTCCGRCGHKHVKGTSCPKPFLSGKRHCRNRK